MAFFLTMEEEMGGKTRPLFRLSQTFFALEFFFFFFFFFFMFPAVRFSFPKTFPPGADLAKSITAIQRPPGSRFPQNDSDFEGLSSPLCPPPPSLPQHYHLFLLHDDPYVTGSRRSSIGLAE